MLRPPRAPAPHGICERVARAAYGWREEAEWCPPCPRQSMPKGVPPLAHQKRR
jgi:hypothetical protein